jgi:hypothetical protein
MCLDHPVANAVTRLALRRPEVMGVPAELLDQPVARPPLLESIGQQRPAHQLPSLVAAPTKQYDYYAEIAKYGWFAIPTGTIYVYPEGSATCR